MKEEVTRSCGASGVFEKAKLTSNCDKIGSVPPGLIQSTAWY